MTTEEIVEIAIQGHASTRDAIRWAIEQEREACAKLMETHSGLPDAGMGYGAALIRARGEK
jgi:hypothetical protein